mgnify:CR=1 FL=1|tara:strand:+ start:524 stop:721 length:198 start_codon:yes stop_codon:yes gene_type:complete
MTIQPFKNNTEKETFEKELKNMLLKPSNKITEWRATTNKLHKEWCKDNGYPTTWSEIKGGRPRKK